MTPQLKKTLITLVVMFCAGVVVSILLLTPKAGTTSQGANTSEVAAANTGESDSSENQEKELQPSTPSDEDSAITEPPAAEEQDPENVESIPQSSTEDLIGLHATASDRGRSGSTHVASSLGSLNPNKAKIFLEFNHVGAGMKRITLSEIWLTARSHQQADIHFEALAKNQDPPPPLPDEALRYVLDEEHPTTWLSPSSGEWQTTYTPVLAAQSIVVEGVTINLANSESWSEIAPGEFEAFILDENDVKILTINRKFSLGNSYDIALDQRITNHTDGPLRIIWRQYGPGDLTTDRARYIDRRRFRFGYLYDVTIDPNREFVKLDDSMLHERRGVIKLQEKANAAGITPKERADYLTLWPNKTSLDENLEFSSFSSTNRYFALSVHPRIDDQGQGSKVLSDVIEKIVFNCTDTETDDPSIFTYLFSPERTIAPGQTLALDMDIYAGPQDRLILKEEPRYTAINLGGLILYQLSSMCAFCTFQWLAGGLLWFLSLVHSIFQDWGVAIILLVVVVRSLLHPITKKSQINMQRFGKQMQALKPEIEKLKKKYGNDAKRMQQEQTRLMREHNVNPLQMLGCLPMFLQTPIWIALYAMLYLAFDIRQEPAFYGIFQMIGGWPFLADLSAADHFFGEFDTPKSFLFWNLTGINLLPILMGVVFFFQQKYMQPPPSPTMTPEQKQQQKIMKFMMVGMFPLMLYSAPSGLTLYILTSTCIGIIESRYVRAHVSEMDLKGPDDKKDPGGSNPKSKKPKGTQARAFSDAIERAKEKQRGKEKKFKKRK